VIVVSRTKASFWSNGSTIPGNYGCLLVSDDSLYTINLILSHTAKISRHLFSPDKYKNVLKFSCLISVRLQSYGTTNELVQFFLNHGNLKFSRNLKCENITCTCRMTKTVIRNMKHVTCTLNFLQISYGFRDSQRK
jgi:hypothetical protein